MISRHSVDRKQNHHDSVSTSSVPPVFVGLPLALLAAVPGGVGRVQQGHGEDHGGRAQAVLPEGRGWSQGKKGSNFVSIDVGPF